jgi:hypothetical protein
MSFSTPCAGPALDKKLNIVIPGPSSAWPAMEPGIQSFTESKGAGFRVLSAAAPRTALE